MLKISKLSTIVCLWVVVVFLAGCSRTSPFEESYTNYIESYDDVLKNVDTYKKFLLDDRVIESNVNLEVEGGEFVWSMNVESSSSIDQVWDVVSWAQADISIGIEFANAQVPWMEYSLDWKVSYRLIEDMLYLLVQKMDVQWPGIEMYSSMIQWFVWKWMYSDAINEAYAEYTQGSQSMELSTSMSAFMDMLRLVANKKFLEEDTTRTAEEWRIPVKIREEVARMIEQNILQMLWDQLSEQELQDVTIAQFLIKQEFFLVTDSEGNVSLEGEISENGDTMMMSLGGDLNTITFTLQGAQTIEIVAKKVSDSTQDISIRVVDAVSSSSQEIFVWEGTVVVDTTQDSLSTAFEMTMNVYPENIMPGSPSEVVWTFEFAQRIVLQSVQSPELPEDAEDLAGLESVLWESLGWIEEAWY